MAYNQYGGNPYGMPPGYGGYGAPPPGRNAPPGLGATSTLDATCDEVLADFDGEGPPPGMAAPPGVGAPPGMQQANAPQSGRPGGLPASFQAPANMPNINFNAPVIRLGTSAPTTDGGGRGDRSQASGGRAGLGMERGPDQGRGAAREAAQMLIPPSADEKLRTIMLHQIPDGVQGDEGVQKLLSAVGTLRKWESAASVLEEHRGTKFGFALFDDAESVSNAVKLLHEQNVEVPVRRQGGSADAPPEDENFEGIEKVALQVAVDPTTLKYAESFEESRADNPAAFGKVEDAQAALRQVLRELFYPPISNGTDVDGDSAMKNDADENVEVVNIPIAQEDELADIPAEMREVVAGEIAAFRERSNQRDLERLRKEEEMEEMERQRNGSSRPAGGANIIPLGPKGTVPNAPSGPRGQNGHHRVSFLNGEFGINDEEDSQASDEELNRRQKKAQQSEDDKAYIDAERKWANRERSRQSALDREQDREKQEAETERFKKDEHLERDKSWDDDREASRKSHLYYRDHGTWARKRGMDRADEESKDDADRRAENDERRREQAQAEKARGMADSFLDQQAEEMDRREAAAAAAPQPFKLSLGAAVQKAQASRVPQRRTIAEVEGLLDDEDTEQSTKRQLVPIQMEPISGAAAMTEEEISQAVRALAQEIPSERDGLWSWEVKWDYMDDSVIREKLRPFVEKKVVDYLGVQEEMLVEAVEEHLRKHGTAGALVEELEGALDEDAEDLVKKLWRMVIFFTESEKRGLPA
ncbi:U1 snRNP-associated protein Usp107 [Metarhizium album ARSEF 1941]|uniref:U1 snRNP-associated protein Usp107 n=1 Tax=Metarhizium album (strain ARSEF 1941) TaxID=1081103 RepID=A0A0B2WTA2_METAS|nr:U1 snRNP-associated protein Usp107 [Metarhizium album ARSEF 1941]KHN96195.1 U1 snRNP-associated protein Usp107 [Metarhizium album ARSEF 1941]